MTNDASLTVGDTAPALGGRVNGDLSGAAVEVSVKRADKTLFVRTAEIVDGPAGVWSLPLLATDLTVKGSYVLEVVVTYASGRVQTFAQSAKAQPVGFKVRDHLG